MWAWCKLPSFLFHLSPLVQGMARLSATERLFAGPTADMEYSLPPNSAFAGSNHLSPTDSTQQSSFSFLEVCKTRHLSSALFHLSKVHTSRQGEFRPSRAARSLQQQPQLHPNGVCGEWSPEWLYSEWRDGRRDFQGRSQRETSDVWGICTAAKMTAMICRQPYTSSQDLASQASCDRVYNVPWTHPIRGGGFPSDSLLFQINTALCIVSQLTQPALEQGLTLSYSEQIRTIFCAVGQIEISPRDGGFFLWEWKLITLGLACTNRKISFFEKQRKWRQAKE